MRKLIVFTLILFIVVFLSSSSVKCKNDVVAVPTTESHDDSTDDQTIDKSKFVKDIKFADSSTNPDKIFHPTNEWQPIKENQAIPKGLHVRLNMQTGEKEAKLLDEDPTGDKMRSLNPSLFKEEAPIPPKKFNYDELKDKLKEIKDESVDEDPEAGEIKKKFRSYEELKKDFEALNMNIKTDSEIISELIEKYKQENIKKEDKITILTDLEYYVHQYDNALLFCDNGGFKIVINELNTTKDDDLRIHSALVIGAAIQGNPKVQIYAVENNVLQLLLNLISKMPDNDKLSSKAIFILAGLMRNFPYAQIKFTSIGGVQTLNDFIKTSNSHKLKVKTLTLINDLLLEKVNVLNQTKDSNDQNTKLKLEQYKKTDLKEKLIDIDWCNSLVSILEESNEHDTREKVLHSINTLLDICASKFRDLKKLNKLITDIISQYNQLSIEQDESDDSDYFKQIFYLAESIKNSLIKIKAKYHFDEDL